ncbi:MAG: hypothetical protein U0325_11220 [Polyangiales bacterium]
MARRKVSSGPVTVLFTPATLPLFRDGMAGLHPLPPSFFDRPCWVHRAGLHADGSIFDALPEGPVDPAVHPHFWAMLSDVVGVMTADDALRRRILDAEGHGRVTLGYHATGDYAAVRAHLLARGPLVDVGELVDAPDDPPPRPEDETLRAVDARMRLGPRPAPARRALREHLHGARGPAPTLSPRGERWLATLFEGVTPRGLNAVHRRALDLLAPHPRRLAELEWRMRFDSPAHDLHALWRETLRARGVGDDVLAPHAAGAWALGAQVNSRAWWVLDLAARDPGGFLARVARSPVRTSIHRRLLFASAITWKLPRFRALVETLLADFGRSLDARAVVELLRDDAARALRPAIAARRAEIVKGRRVRDLAALVAAFDAARASEGDPRG